MRPISRALRFATLALSLGLFLHAAFAQTAQAPSTPAAAGAARPAARPDVAFSLIRTASMPVRDGLMYAGGDFFKKTETVYSAVLVRHGEDSFLFDTGLGRHIAEQFAADMPLFFRPLFRYGEPVTPAREQLDRAGIRLTHGVYLSHIHWDHASGLNDFADQPIHLPAEELAEVRAARPGTGTAWPSQVSQPGLQWKEIRFADKPYAGFARSLDVFGDGTVVMVPMPGHTPGSVGMFITVSSGTRYFFVGDVIWHAGALATGAPKFWAASLCVDRDRDAVQKMIERIRQVMADAPDTVVVPAHDGAVQGKLGYFPGWVN